MSEYLSKEEIKKWRSSLEKITLEEFAARLGKKIEQKKTTNDLVDMVLHGKPVISNESDWNNKNTAERLSTIAAKAMEKEKDLYISTFSVKKLQDELLKPEKDTHKEANVKKETKKITKKEPIIQKAKETVKSTKTKAAKINNNDMAKYTFKKALTDREQKVFDYFYAHQNKIVYAKDLAILLDLPRDYVYKYIKNLRAKLEGDTLQNADKGGFVLS